jgi:hypothetical protein
MNFCRYVFLSASIGLLLVANALGQDAQKIEATGLATNAKPSLNVSSQNPKGIQPVLQDYRGVRIGMDHDEVRDLLEKPKDAGDKQDVFSFSDDEMAQVFYDATGHVYAISVTYTGSLEKAPADTAVLGEAATAKPDGSVYKMVRYPDAGYWISYSRSSGKNAMVTITIRKI